MIVLIAVFVAAGTGLLVYLFYFKPAMRKLDEEIIKFYPCVVTPAGANEALINEVQLCQAVATNAQEMEKFAGNLYFPRPGDVLPGQSGAEIMEAAYAKADLKAMGVAGIEQLAFIAFPPGQVAECLRFALDRVIHHGSQAGAESLLSVKASLMEGWYNAHDPQLLMESLKQFTAAIFKGVQNHESLHHLAGAIQEQHFGHILQHVVNWGTVSHGLDPLMHVHQHLAEIGHAVGSHALSASGEIAHHAASTIHPDPTGHFPFVTLVMSGIREIKLLRDRKTAIETSLTNVALDVAGTGSGAFLGGKGGAAIGTLIVPGIGTIIGGLVGAIGGALAGRYGTDKIKRRSLKKALEGYAAEFDGMQKGTRAMAVSCVGEINIHSLSAEDEFKNQAGVIPQLGPGKKDLAEIGEKLVSEQRMQLNGLSLKLERLGKSPAAIFSKYKEQLRALRLQINQYRLSLPVEEYIATSPEAALTELTNLPTIGSSHYNTLLEESANELKNKNATQSAALVFWAVNASNEYQKAIHSIFTKFGQEAERFSQCMQQWKSKLEEKEAVVNTEKGKLGIA